MDILDEIRESLKDKIISWQEPNEKRVYFDIKPQDVLDVTRILFGELHLRFITASGQEVFGGSFQIIYHFSADKSGKVVNFKVDLPKDDPQVDSIANIIVGAEWIEREMWELLGIKFKGHPNLKRLLLAEEWPKESYPLRHDHEHEHEHEQEHHHDHEDEHGNEHTGA